MNEHLTHTAFLGTSNLYTGPLAELLPRLKALHDGGHLTGQSIVIFEDATGKTLDFDLTGPLDAVLERALPTARSGPGRPKLGVTSREVSLLPRHWEWLERGRGGASATLRRLIDEARRADPEGERRQQATEAAGRFMTVMAGDLPGYEEASRALYAGDTARLRTLTAAWPEAVQTHLLYLLDPPFGQQP